MITLIIIISQRVLNYSSILLFNRVIEHRYGNVGKTHNQTVDIATTWVLLFGIIIQFNKICSKIEYDSQNNRW